MSRLLTYYDNLLAHLGRGTGDLKELTPSRVLFVTGEDPQQAKAIDSHVKTHVMLTKGIGAVVFGDSGDNQTAEDTDAIISARLDFEVRLFIHPQKWSQRYDPTKRQALELLESLLIHLNGAEIAPYAHCHHRTMVDAWAPVADPEFWAWNIVCHRDLELKPS